jgi:hypothetical protein
MPRKQGLIALVLTLAVAVPAPAFGQSAGDEQYVDPFQDPPAEPEGGQGNSGSGGGSGGGSQGGTDQGGDGTTGTTTPEVPDSTTVAPESTPAPGAEQTAEGSGTLPRSGPALASPLLLGLLFLAAGVALRRGT